ncbi:predicted protein [Nematostella vectensis]|uniref:Histone-lysine N-methyltransferase SMYD3 n=2 Tax=Nematostella vectensis TaxID=45351 RepID=A7SLD5_NEMVE|nr:predicted protein [Nematostella vectensis]|eukprot:XP_001627600.1 predicted protein [Nematostella vectensis]
MAPKPSVFEVFETESKGRGLRAAKPLKSGDTILSEQPVVYMLSNMLRGQRCDFCLEKLSDLQRCSRCKFARYCGASCQRAAWRIHKSECERLKRVFPRVPTDLVLLMFRVWQLKSQNGWYDSLVSNVEKIDSDAKEDFVSVLMVLNEYLGSEISPPEGLELFSKISCNSFAICDGEMQAIGTGIFPNAVCLNHSCAPNSVAVFNGTNIYIKALEEIPVGEELTISYIQQLHPRETRQEELQTQFCFYCQCHRCLDASDNNKMLTSLICPNKSCEAIVYQTFDACVMEQDWTKALEYATRNLEVYTWFYPKYHPCLGVHLYKIGKLLAVTHQDLELAVKRLEQARRILEVTHGQSHPLVQELCEYLCQASEELRQGRI